MTKGFDTDGFSKTSKVHASKKPLTVAKAPSFGRTTSRAGQTTTGGSDSPPTNQNKGTQPVKPTQATRAGAPRTTTPAQSTSRTSKTGASLQTKLLVTSPKHTTAGRRLADTITQREVRSPGSKNALSDLDPHKAVESGETPANDDQIKDENDLDGALRATTLQDHQRLAELNHRIAVKDGEVRDLQEEIQGLHITKDAETQELQARINGVRTANELKNEETKAAFLAQIALLESKVDDARKKSSDLEATHRKAQEEYRKLLSLKDEELQEMLGKAHGQRGEQEAKESVLSLKGEFQLLQAKHKRELDEAATAVSAEVETIRAEQDELLRSRDQEIKEMSDLVQELQEKVEKAHQADKDELKEAEKRHKQELQGKVEQHEQELRDATTQYQNALQNDVLQREHELWGVNRRYEELQEKLLRLEQEHRYATTKHVQEMNGAKEEHQTILRDINQRHEQESRDTASRNQQEMEDLMITHHEKIKTARSMNEQVSKDSAATQQQEIETLIAKHKEELKTAAARQEQAFGDAAAKYQEESQTLEAKHLEDLRIASTRDEQESGTSATKHQQEMQTMIEKHQDELGEIITKNGQELGNAAIKTQQATDVIIAKHREEAASAASQIGELRAVTQRLQQELGDVATNHVEEIERVNHEHQQKLRGVTTKCDQELEEEKTKYKELEDGLLKKEQESREAAWKHEEETARLQNKLETATGHMASLDSTLRDLNLQKEDSGREAAAKYEQELRTATLKYEEELQSLRTIYATAVEEITALKRTIQDVEQKQSEAVEEELQSLRTIYATAVEEITALRRKVDDVDQKRSEAIDEVATLKASLDDLDLKRSEAVGQLTSLQGFMKSKELERSEAAVETALLRDKLELADRRFEQDQQAVSDLQRQTRGLQAQLAELSTDTNLDGNEAAVDVALLKDKLELADLEIHLHKGTISALQNETGKLQTQLAEQSADTNLDRNEAVVDVALLKDKLELSDIQIRQAKGTVSNLQEEIEELKTQITNSTVGADLDQNEVAVESALLKNTLELANLESHQDKATITNLQKQIEGLQAQITDTPETGSYTHHQLRGELSMLGRHQAAQMIDLESLKTDMAAESELREQEWKERAEFWDRLASELQGMNTELVGPVAGSSWAVSTG